MRALAGAVAATLVAFSAEAHTPRHAAPWQLASRAPARPRRGRPRKFSRPSRSVTLTLPDDVIDALHAIDADLSWAVVRVTQPVVPSPPREPLTVASYGDDAVIVVPRNRVLNERTGVDLVPLSDGGALISFDDGISVSQLELRLRDALADPALENDDRALFEALATLLRRARQADGLALRERRIIVLRRTADGDSAVDASEQSKNERRRTASRERSDLKAGRAFRQ
jgi:hypothetical protein